MDPFTLSVVVGAVAGALDVVPMLFRRLPLYACVSAFLVFLFAGILVFHSDLPYLPWWADGMAVTLMLALPVLFHFTGKERKSVPIVVFNALLYGFLIGAAEHFLA